MLYAGAAGSIQAMISSLKNNKNLLGKRKPYKEILREYRNRFPHNSIYEASEEDKEEFRQRLRDKIKKENRKNIMSFLIVLITVSVSLYFILDFLLT
jgi:hypothetical protein